MCKIQRATFLSGCGRMWTVKILDLKSAPCGIIGSPMQTSKVTDKEDVRMRKTLVAYFSASGVTAKAAERLAKEIGADLFQIQPEAPYTDADLDWMDKKSRSSVEMNDKSCRPAIRSRLEDMGQYDVLFIGFPIWWYREPSIIDTFLEAYDLNGKTIVPFATSGGSPMGDTAKNMQALAPGAKVVAGKRIAADISSRALAAWAAEWI